MAMADQKDKAEKLLGKALLRKHKACKVLFYIACAMVLMSDGVIIGIGYMPPSQIGWRCPAGRKQHCFVMISVDDLKYARNLIFCCLFFVSFPVAFYSLYNVQKLWSRRNRALLRFN